MTPINLKLMQELPVIEETNTHTLRSIDELYKNHKDINRIYHFQYKTEESANNFGNLPMSLLDKSSHHTIFEVDSCIDNTYPNNLIVRSKNKLGDLTIAYGLIPDNYRFDVISSKLDGKTLVIYDKHIHRDNRDNKCSEDNINTKTKRNN